MAKYAWYAFALVLLSIGSTANAQKLPTFVSAEMKTFEANPSYHARAAWAKPFGWGTGTYRLAEGREIPFEWFAWTNTDGYFQMDLSTRVYGTDLKGVRAMKDVLNRPYEVSANTKRTYIGLSNDWFMDEKGMPFCKLIKGQYHYNGQSVLKYYLNRLSTSSPKLHFEVVAYLR